MFTFYWTKQVEQKWNKMKSQCNLVAHYTAQKRYQMLPILLKQSAQERSGLNGKSLAVGRGKELLSGFEAPMLQA